MWCLVSLVGSCREVSLYSSEKTTEKLAQHQTQVVSFNLARAKQEMMIQHWDKRYQLFSQLGGDFDRDGKSTQFTVTAIPSQPADTKQIPRHGYMLHWFLRVPSYFVLLLPSLASGMPVGAASDSTARRSIRRNQTNYFTRIMIVWPSYDFYEVPCLWKFCVAGASLAAKMGSGIGR